MERGVGGGIGMGNTCKPWAVSFQCMTKSVTNKKKKMVKKKKRQQKRHRCKEQTFGLLDSVGEDKGRTV